MKVHSFVKTWWLAAFFLCALPAAAIGTTLYFTVPKIPACIGAARRFARGVNACRDEFSVRQADMKTNMLTGRILLRSFAICARLDSLQLEANLACGWLVAEDLRSDK